MEIVIKHQKKSIQDDVVARIAAVEEERKPLADQIETLQSEKKQIHIELTKER